MTSKTKLVELSNVYLDIPVFDYSFRKLSKTMFSRPRLARKETKTTVVRALSDVSLELTEGSRLGVIGDNGAGKSSLLRLIAGIYSPTRGTAKVSGKVASLLDISLGIEADLTGRESIYARGDLMGITRKQLLALEEEIVSFAGIGNAINLPTRTYSSGMQIRLGFAISTAIAPDILVMDEWLSVGDQAFRERAQLRLETLIQGAKILVLASHSRELVEDTCDTVIWLEGGAIKEIGPPKLVCNQYFTH